VAVVVVVLVITQTQRLFLVVLAALGSTPVKTAQLQPQAPEIKVAQAVLVQAAVAALQIELQRLAVQAVQVLLS